MPGGVEFIIEVLDRATAPLKKVQQGLDDSTRKFDRLTDAAKRIDISSRSIDGLRSAIDKLRQKRDLLPGNGLNQLRAYNTEIKRLETQINKLSTVNGSKLKSAIGSFVDNMPFGGLARNPAFAAGAGILASVREAGKRQSLNTSMGVLLGGEEKAKPFIKDVTNMAAKTPYETGDLMQGAQTLSGFGMSQDKLIPTMKMMGDVAMGNADKLHGLTLAFAQIQSTGKLTGQDLLQMINNGFNPLLQISKQTGKSMAQLKEDMENGAISADMVTKAFEGVTGPGGQFFGMMDKMAETWEGKLSTFMDNFKETLIQIGNIILPVATAALGALSDVLGFVSSNLDILGVAAAAFAVNWWAVNAATIGVTLGFKLAAAATWLWNAALNANPIMWIVAALGLMFIGLRKAWESSETFRATLWGLWEVIKEVGSIIYERFVMPLQAAAELMAGIFTFDAELIGKSLDTAAASIQSWSTSASDRIGNAWQAGFDKGVADFASDQNAEKLQFSVDTLFSKVNFNAPLSAAGLLGKENIFDKIKSDKAAAGTIIKKPGAEKKLRAATNSISSGGVRPTTINMTFHKLQDQIVIHTTNLQTGSKQAGEMVVEEILRALNGANAALAAQ